MRAPGPVSWLLLSASVFLTMLLVAAVFSCALIHPRPSDPCSQGDEVCQAGGALVCRAGKYVLTHCGGPASCTVASSRTVSCDQTAGAVGGEPCLPAYEGQAQCSGPSTYVKCTAGTWTALACKAGGCQRSGESIVCQAP